MFLQTPDVAVFRQALAAVLSRSAPPGEFNVKEPKALSDAVITPEDFEGEAVRLSRLFFYFLDMSNLHVDRCTSPVLLVDPLLRVRVVDSSLLLSRTILHPLLGCWTFRSRKSNH